MTHFTRFVCALFLALTACGTDSMQDQLNQERDRQRSNSTTLINDYKQVTGDYETAENKDVSQYFVMARINLSYVQKDGSLVPQPSISGSFRLFDKTVYKEHLSNLAQADHSKQSTPAALEETCGNAQDSSGQCGYVLSFSNGVYDSASKILALHIPGYGVSGTDVSCDTSSAQNMICRWLPASGGTGGFTFVMGRYK